MSTIDERVVSLQFNNKDFEKGISESMESLENLDDVLNALGNSGGSEALDQLGDSAKGMIKSMLGIDQAERGLRGIISLFGQLTKFHIVNDAARQVAGFVTSITDSVNAVSNAAVGFSKYSEKTQAMQTIVAATGRTIDQVEPTIQKLLKYVDETSYSFTDMVGSIGKFTAQGIGLEAAEQAMEGISNWAALSGQGIAQANSAMYNLAQSLAMGSVKLQDWKSIENANMATKEFKETVIDLAKDMGILTKEGKTAKGTLVTYKNFSQTLDEGWFSSDLLMKVLQKYADQEDELGKKAFKAAQQATTFQQAIDAVKDAATTGWLQTWEYLFGNLDEATKLWTDFATALQEVVGVFSEARNSLLRGWNLLGGRNDIIEGVIAVWESFLEIGEEIADVFNDIFNPFDEIVESITEYADELDYASRKGTQVLHIVKGEGENVFGAFSLKNLTAGIKEFGQNVKKWLGESIEVGGKTATRLDLIGNAARTAFTIIGTVAKSIGRAIGTITKAIGYLQPVFDSILKIIGDSEVAEFFTDIFNSEETIKENANFWEFFAKAIQFAADAIDKLWAGFKQLVKALGLDQMIANLLRFDFDLSSWNSITGWIMDAVRWVQGIGGDAWNAIMDFLFGEEQIGSLLDVAAGKGKKRSGGIVGAVVNFWNDLNGENGAWTNIVAWFDTAKTWVEGAATTAYNAIRNFLLGTTDEETGTQTEGVIQKLLKWWNGSEGETGAWESIRTWFTNAFVWVTNAGRTAFNAIRDFLFGTTDEETGTQTEGVIQKLLTWWNGSEGETGAWESIKTWFTNAFTWAVNAGRTAFNAIRDFLFGTTDEETGTQTEGAIQKLLKWWNGSEGETGAWESIKTWFTRAFTWAVNAGRTAFNAIRDFLLGTADEETGVQTEGVIQKLLKWWNGSEGETGAWESIKTWFTNAFTWAVNAGRTAFNAIRDFLFGTTDEETGTQKEGAIQKLLALWNGVDDEDGAWSKIKKWFQDAYDWCVDTGVTLWNGILGFFNGSGGEGEGSGDSTASTEDGGFLKAISDWWNGTGDSRGAWDSIVTWAGEVITWLTTTGAELWSSLLSWFSGGSGNSAQSVINDSTANVAGQALGSMVAAIGGVSEAVDAAESVDSGAAETTNGLTGFCDSIIGWLNSNSSGIAAAGPVVEQLSGLLTSVFNLIFTIAEDIAILKGTKGIFKAGKETIKSWNKFAKADDTPATFGDYFMEFAKALALVAVCIAGIFALNEINPAGMDKALAVVGGIAAILVIISVVFYALGKQKVKTDFGKMLLNFASAIGILAVVIAALSFFNPAKIIVTAAGVLVFVGILVAIETVASKHTGKNKIGGLESVAWATVILMIPVLILYALSFTMDGGAWVKLIESAAFILVFAFALAMIGAFSSKLAGENKLSGLIGLAFSLVLLMVPLLIVYTMIRTEHAGELFGAIFAIILMLGALAAAAITISKFASNVGAAIAVFVVMGLLLAEFGVIVDSMKAIPSDVIWAVAGGFSVMMGVMAGIVALFAALPTGGLFIGIAAIALLGAALEGLIALAGVVADFTSEKMSSTMDNLGEIVQKAGEIPWDDLDIPTSAKRSIENLVDILVYLSGGAFTTTITDFLTDMVGGEGASDSKVLSMIDRLKEFGSGIAEFAKNVSAADTQELHNATLAADLGKMLTDLDAALIKNGQNIFDRIVNGEKGLVPFSRNLGEIGKNFAEFAGATSRVDSESSQKIATAMKYLVEATEITNRIGNVDEGVRKVNSILDGVAGADIDKLIAFSDRAAAGGEYSGILNFTTAVTSMTDLLKAVYEFVWSAGGGAIDDSIKAMNMFFEDLNSVDIGVFMGKDKEFSTAGQVTGKFYVSGLKKGISDKGGLLEVGAAATTLGEKIDSSVRKVLGIHSPSDVAMKTGVFYTKGLADGIEKGESTVGDATTNLVGSIQGPFDSLKEYFDNFSLFGNDPVTGQARSFEDLFSGIFGEGGFDVNAMFGVGEGETLLGKLGFNMEDLQKSMGITNGQDFGDVMGIPKGGFAEMIGLGADSGGLAGVFGLGEGQTIGDVLGIPKGGFAEMIGLGADSGGLAGVFGLTNGQTMSSVLGIPEGGIGTMLGIGEGGLASLFSLGTNTDGSQKTVLDLMGVDPDKGVASLFGDLPEGGVPALLGLQEGGIASLFTFGNNADGSPMGLADIFDFSSISEQMGTVFSTDPNAQGGIMNSIQSFISEASADITDGLTLSPVITPVLDMSNITGNKIFGGTFTKDGKLKAPVLAGSTGGPVAAVDLAGKVLYSRNETSSDRDLLSSIVDNTSRTASSLTNKNDNGIIRAINNLPAAIAVALEGLTVNIDGDKVGDATSGRVGGNLQDDRGRILGGFGRPRY